MLRAFLAAVILLACPALAGNDGFTASELQVIPLALTDGRLVCESPEPKITAEGLAPYFAWEGCASTVVISQSPGFLSIFWKLDIIGPSWACITLDQDRNGVSIYAMIYDYDASDPSQEDCRCYSSWQELLTSHNDDLAQIAVLCLHRIGRDAHLRPRGS